MAALWFTLGVVVGGVISYFLIRVRVSVAETLIAGLAGDVERLRQERDSAARDAGALREGLARVREAAAQGLGSTREEAAQALAIVQIELERWRTRATTAEVALGIERKASAERVSALQQAEERINERAKAALTGALGTAAQHLVALAKAELVHERAEDARGIDKAHEHMGRIFASVTEALSTVTAKLDEIEKERIAAREQLHAHLAVLRDAQGELMSGTRALVGAL